MPEGGTSVAGPPCASPPGAIIHGPQSKADTETSDQGKSGGYQTSVTPAQSSTAERATLTAGSKMSGTCSRYQTARWFPPPAGVQRVYFGTAFGGSAAVVLNRMRVTRAHT